MKKYFLVMRNTWDEMVTYRLNFVMWRVRTVLQILTLYFLWLAIIPSGTEIFGYTNTHILTYVLGISLISAIVLSTRTHEIGENINKGDLSIFLIRPMRYFSYWFARDIGDKLFNIMFSLGEFVLLFLLLRPPFFIQTDPSYLFFFFISICFAAMLYFLLGCLLGMIGFWSPEVWAPRFILFILINFLSGGVFPLDIIPKELYAISQMLPFGYLLYFPLKIYLGQLPFPEIMNSLVISAMWVFILYVVLQIVWIKGLRVYTAVGR